MVLSLFDQMILTPPVDDDSSLILPEVIFVSSSFRKDCARESLISANAFLAALASRSCFTGLFLVGEKRSLPGVFESGLVGRTAF